MMDGDPEDGGTAQADGASADETDSLDEEGSLRLPKPVKDFTPAKASGNFHAHHLAGLWISGLINNFSYVVFLTAAEDILTGFSGAVSQRLLRPHLDDKCLLKSLN
jgi:hypothetical protein